MSNPKLNPPLPGNLPEIPEEPKPQRKKLIGGIITTILGVLLIVGVIWGLSSLFEKLAAEPVAASDHLLVQGSLKTTETNINSKLSGSVKEILVEEGQQIKAGQTLLTLDSGELKAKVSQAQAAVGQAKAGVGQAQASVSKAKAGVSQAQAGITQAQATVDQASAAVGQGQAKVKQAEAAIAAAQSQCDLAVATKAYAQTQYDKAVNGARPEEISQLKTAYELAESSYNRAKSLYEAGAATANDYDQAEASYLMAKAKYEEAVNGSRPEDIAAASASIAEAEAGIKAAESQVAQAEGAKEEANSGLQQAQAAQNIAQSALAQTRATAEQTQATYQQAEAAYQQAQATLQQAEASLEEAQVYLGYATITAPTAGTITALNIEKGELVSTGMALLTISDLSNMWVEVNVDETDLGAVSLHEEVAVSLPAFPDQTFAGEITKISQNPDFATTRATNASDDFDILSYAVKVKISGLEKEYSSPGMTVVVDFGKLSEKVPENAEATQ